MPISNAAALLPAFVKKARIPLIATLAVIWWVAANAKGAEPAVEAPKTSEGDQPEYVKRGPFAGGAKHPAPCDHKLHLPILVPQTTIDNEEYCGGAITLF